MPRRNPSEGLGVMARGTAGDEQALALLHSVGSPRGLTPEQVQRIAKRLDATIVPGRRRALIPVMAAFALALVAGTAVAWATGALHRLASVRALFTSPESTVHPPVPSTVKAASPSIALASPATPDIQTPAPALAPPGPSSSLHRRANPAVIPPARKQAESAYPAPPVPASQISQELASFDHVLRTWRRGRDGRAALAALDLHDRLFVPAQMAIESRLLRIEILLSQGRDGEALSLLDRLALEQEGLPRRRELLTVRGELRIKQGRCKEGEADLAPLGRGTDAFAERARNALSRCP